MAMFIAANPETRVGILQILPQVEGLRPEITDWVVSTTHTENMKPVTETDLLGSLAAYVAYTNDGQGGLEPVGFLRQRTEYGAEINVSDVTEGGNCYTLFANELATLLVKPSHRGRGWAIADELVRTASATMLDTEVVEGGLFLPYAVCNPDGGKVFDRTGYDTVGTMQTEQGARHIKMLPPLFEPALMRIWHEYDLGGAVARGLGGETDRFAGLTVEGTDNSIGKIGSMTFLRKVAA
jgi:hypothetical protein